MFSDLIFPAGVLPKWILFVRVTTHHSFNPWLTALHQTAALSLNSTIICYASTSTALVRRIYSHATPSDVTPLSSRTFGIWNLLSTIVRIYAAYHIHEQTVYTLGLWTYIVALAHFGGEWLIFGTAGGKGMLAAEATPVFTIIAMLWQWNQYVGDGSMI
jgi:hypothetical protein